MSRKGSDAIDSPGTREEEQSALLEHEYQAPTFDLEADFSDLPGTGDEGRKESQDVGAVPDEYIADEANRERLGADEDGGEAEGEDEDEGREEDESEGEDEDDLRLRLRRAEAKASEVDALKASVQQLQADRTRNQEREYEDAVKAHETRRGEIQDRLKKAIADGDPEAQYDAQIELSEHLAQKPVKPEAPATPAPESSAPASAPSLPPKAQAYADRNLWIGNPRYREMNERLMEVDRELAEEGFDHSDDRYFFELSRRLRREFPRQKGIISDLKRPEREKENPVHGRRSEKREDPKKPGKVDRRRLTAADVATMRRFGLDPQNKRVAEEFLRNKLPDPV